MSAKENTDDRPQQIVPAEKKQDSLALVIPCAAADYGNLCELLRRLIAHSTSQPDRIVVALSESNVLSSEQKHDLEALLRQWHRGASEARKSTTYMVVYTPHKALAGANRNRAIDYCQFSDIIVCHDADDDIHPQKIAILRHWFSKRPDVLHICHWAMAYGYEWPQYDDFDAVPTDECEAVHRIGLKFYTNGPLMRGMSAFRRAVHDAVRFRDNYKYGEDTCFCREVQGHFGPRSLVIRAPLAKYDLFACMPKEVLNQRSDWQRKKEPRGLLLDRTKPDWTAHVTKRQTH